MVAKRYGAGGTGLVRCTKEGWELQGSGFACQGRTWTISGRLGLVGHSPWVLMYVEWMGRLSSWMLLALVLLKLSIPQECFMLSFLPSTPAFQHSTGGHHG